MPSPPGHWLLGHIPALRKAPLELLDKCEGDLTPLRLGRTAWLALNPRDILYILENSGTTYTKGRAFRFGRQLYGNSLLVSEGEEHRRQIREIGGLFFRHAANSFLQPAVEITNRWLQRWRDGEELDLWSSVIELTLAISSQAVFGGDWLPSWMVEDGNDHADRILRSYDRAMSHVAVQNFSLLPMPDWVPTSENRGYARAIRRLNKAVADSIERRLAGQTAGGFLDALLAAHRKDPLKVSLEQVRDQSLVLTLGGYESTATALCWTILLLSGHDSIRGPMRDEIRAVVDTPLPRVGHAKRLCYTGQVFSESLRLYPPPWLIPRTAAVDDTLPSGGRIRGGAQLFLSPWRTHRDARYFSDPLAFDPDRFEPSRSATIIPGSYFPFGTGPRHCIGESIARAQATLILATIFRRHEFHPVTGETPTASPLLTLRPTLPVPVRMKRVE